MSFQKIKKLNISRIDENHVDSLVSIISTERSILFTGAGYSTGSLNVLDTEPPMANKLAKLICRSVGMKSDSDLSYVSDYCLNNFDKNILLKILKRNYTIKNDKPYHRTISSLKWKRVYTTNYDDLFEYSSAKCNNPVNSLTAEDDPKIYFKKKNSCVHINGTIRSVSEDDLDSKFKLTRTSYVTGDSLVNSNWYYYFKKDLEQCSAIIFIGYSLYDIDIEKILFSSPLLKKKTYFIVGKNPSEKEMYILSKYGNVLPIGIEKFAAKIRNKKITYNNSNEFWTDSLSRYSLSEIDKKISDDEIMNFILYGSLDDKYFDSSFAADQVKPYLIIRKCLDTVDDLIRKNYYLAILGDFGNGKTTVLRQICSHYSMLGKNVFYLENIDGDYESDIEKIDSLEEESIIIIDNYTLNIDLLIFISSFNSNKIRVIFSDRTQMHDHSRKKLNDINLEYAEISIDSLQKEEVSHMVKVIDNLGFWGKKASWKQGQKEEHISHFNTSQLSLILLNLFDSPQIKNRISTLLQPMLSDKLFKDTIFAICILQVAGVTQNLSLISEVSESDFIYRSELSSNTYFRQLFNINNEIITTKSSLFSIKLLNNHFTSSYITNRLLDLVEKYNKLKGNGYVENELFKSFLKFSFIERLLPEKGRLNSLVKYYEELKIRAYWLRFDPHFWLQYGMARMAYGELDKAQLNLDESYVHAESRQNYYTNAIDTQQARLYLLKSLQKTNGNEVWDLFQKAHSLLTRVEDNSYKYRQVKLYNKVYEKKYSILSKKNRINFITYVTSMKTSIEMSHYQNIESVYCDKTIRVCYNYLEYIIKRQAIYL